MYIFNSSRDITCFWNKCLIGAELQGLRECEGLDDFISPKLKQLANVGMVCCFFAFIVMNCVDN